MKRILILLILVPIAIIVVALAVANRHSVNLTLPPELGFEPWSVPLFVLLFATLFLGMVIGSMATWFKQGKHRKTARAQKVEATKMAFEAEKQKTRAEELAAEVAGDMSQEQKAFSALGLPGPKKAA